MNLCGLQSKLTERRYKRRSRAELPLASFAVGANTWRWTHRHGAGSTHPLVICVLMFQLDSAHFCAFGMIIRHGFVDVDFTPVFRLAEVEVLTNHTGRVGQHRMDKCSRRKFVLCGRQLQCVHELVRVDHACRFNVSSKERSRDILGTRT